MNDLISIDIVWDILGMVAMYQLLYPGDKCHSLRIKIPLKYRILTAVTILLPAFDTSLGISILSNSKMA